MSPAVQIVHGAVFGLLFVISLASLGTDSGTWPFFAAVLAIGTASLLFLSNH